MSECPAVLARMNVMRKFPAAVSLQEASSISDVSPLLPTPQAAQLLTLPRQGIFGRQDTPESSFIGP